MTHLKIDNSFKMKFLQQKIEALTKELLTEKDNLNIKVNQLKNEKRKKCKIKS